MRKNFLRYWASAGALLILMGTTSRAQNDEEFLKADFEAYGKRLIEAAEKEKRLCRGRPHESDPPQPKMSENLGEPPNDWASVRIKYTRSMPNYTVEISGNGDVTWIGRANVHVRGIQRSRISQESVRDLYESFVSAGYFSMGEIYCTNVIPHQTTTTSIEYDGRMKEVINLGTGPDELRYLERKIDEVAGILKWMAVPVPPDPQFQWLLRQRCAEKSIDDQFCKNL